MKIFTKTVKVLGVTEGEFNDLIRLITDAKAKGRAEIQIGPSQYLAVEVNEMHAYRERTREERR